MSEAKFTEGPWSAADGDGNYYGIFGPDGDPIAYLVEISGYGFVRLLPGHDGPSDYPHWRTHEANARLIAAAPDLFAALDRLIARYHPYRDNQEDSDWVAAITALAKARGET